MALHEMQKNAFLAVISCMWFLSRRTLPNTNFAFYNLNTELRVFTLQKTIELWKPSRTQGSNID